MLGTVISESTYNANKLFINNAQFKFFFFFLNKTHFADLHMCIHAIFQKFSVGKI